ncbi:MAG: hypothetical protein ACK58N_09525 [Synechocystis sp.]
MIDPPPGIPLQRKNPVTSKIPVDENAMSEPIKPADINSDPATENATDLHLDVHFPLYTFKSVTINDTGDLISQKNGRAQYYRENLGNGVYLDMTYIPGGTFLKGSPATEVKTSWSQGREEPQHAIALPPLLARKICGYPRAMASGHGQ